MAANSTQLGLRISSIRNAKGLSQESLSEKASVSREHIARIESGKKAPSIDTLVDIANALDVSADDLLVDSLKHSSSTTDSDLHRLLLDCNPKEELILVQTVKALKSILYSEGI